MAVILADGKTVWVSRYELDVPPLRPYQSEEDGKFSTGLLFENGDEYVQTAEDRYPRK
jgi:hypothetical protein